MSKDNSDNNKEIFIEIIYKTIKDKNNKVRIFGLNFVLNNKDKCKIIYEDKEYELKEYFDDINKNYDNKIKIALTLKVKETIIDSSYMFDGCKALFSFPYTSLSITDANNEKDYSVSPLFDEIQLQSNINNINNFYNGLGQNQIPSNLTTIKNNILNNTEMTSNLINILDKIPKVNSLSSLIN